MVCHANAWMKDNLQWIPGRVSSCPDADLQKTRGRLIEFPGASGQGWIILKDMVPVGRIELPLGCPNRILSPARLPVPPHRHGFGEGTIVYKKSVQKWESQKSKSFTRILSCPFPLGPPEPFSLHFPILSAWPRAGIKSFFLDMTRGRVQVLSSTFTLNAFSTIQTSPLRSTRSCEALSGLVTSSTVRS